MSMRQLARSAGSMSVSPSQNFWFLPDVNDLIASPFRPWTATMLGKSEKMMKQVSSVQADATHSITGFSAR